MDKNSIGRGSCVAQLVERLLAKIYIEQFFIVNCNERTKIKKKRPGMALFKNSKLLSIYESTSF